MDVPSNSTNQDHLNKIRMFLAAGGDPNFRDEFQNTQLHISATIEDRSDVIEELVRASAGVDLVNCFGLTPSHIAVLYRHYRVVIALINFEASVNTKDHLGNGALHYAIKSCMPRDQDWNCNMTHCSHKTPDTDIIITFLQNEYVDINIKNREGYTPLLIVVQDKHLGIVKALLTKSALVSLGSNHQETPLHAALCYPNPSMDIARELLLHGASIESLDRNGTLFVVCDSDHFKTYSY